MSLRCHRCSKCHHHHRVARGSPDTRTCRLHCRFFPRSSNRPCRAGSRGCTRLGQRRTTDRPRTCRLHCRFFPRAATVRAGRAVGGAHVWVNAGRRSSSHVPPALQIFPSQQQPSVQGGQSGVHTSGSRRTTDRPRTCRLHCRFFPRSSIPSVPGGQSGVHTSGSRRTTDRPRTCRLHCRFFPRSSNRPCRAGSRGCTRLGQRRVPRSSSRRCSRRISPSTLPLSFPAFLLLPGEHAFLESLLALLDAWQCRAVSAHVGDVSACGVIGVIGGKVLLSIPRGGDHVGACKVQRGVRQCGMDRDVSGGRRSDRSRGPSGRRRKTNILGMFREISHLR